MSCKVRVEPSGREFTVQSGETILDAALVHGVSLPYGCRNGACGACKGKVLSGEVTYGDHEPTALSEQDRAEQVAVLCQAKPRGDVTLQVTELEASQDIPVKTLPARIERLERFTDDVMGVWLKLPDTERLQYLAGQYIDILLKDGRRRAFSVANPPHDDALLELHIRHIQGGRFTDELFSSGKEKDMLRIEGPRGSFFLREDSQRPIIMLATGTGFGPVKALIEHALAEGVQRPIHLYWGARDRAGLYLDALARGWAEGHANVHYTPVLSRPAPEDRWDGRTGYVQEAVLADFEDLSDFEVYACGLPEMVHTAKAALTARGLDPQRCYSDAFEYAKD